MHCNGFYKVEFVGHVPILPADAGWRNSQCTLPPFLLKCGIWRNL
jgi:hypothetical protein